MYCLWQQPLKQNARLLIRVQEETMKAAISKFFYLKIRKKSFMKLNIQIYSAPLPWCLRERFHIKDTQGSCRDHNTVRGGRQGDLHWFYSFQQLLVFSLLLVSMGDWFSDLPQIQKSRNVQVFYIKWSSTCI